MKKTVKKTAKPGVVWVVRTMSNSAGDWEALYVDGNLIDEGHHVDVMSSLARFNENIPVGIEILNAHVEDDDCDNMKNWIKYCGGTVNCPKKWTPKLEALAQKQKKAFEKEKS